MHTSFFGQLESYKNTKKGETGMSEKEKGPLEECQKREGPKDAKKGGPRHARGEGGGPKKKEDPGMSEKEKNRSQGSLKNVASTVRSAVNYGRNTNMRGDQRYSSGHQKYKYSAVHHQAKSSAAKYEECLEYNVGVLG